MRAADTNAGVHRLQFEAYRAMAPEERVRLSVQMSEDVFAIAAAGIRARHPEYDEATLRWALRRLRVGDDLFAAVWPDGPLVTP